jgi:isopentenyl-diphosphate delta-isomerase
MTDSNEAGDFDHVVLVDQHDNPLGTEEKLRAHAAGGRLHRAFSVFILNPQREILLQRRAGVKYHCAGLWSNSCCSHPRAEREVVAEARIRLRAELGFTTDLEPIGQCTYKVSVDNGQTEWELDHLFVGDYDGAINPDPQEVDSVRWCRLGDLEKELADNPAAFTPWLPHILPHFANWYRSN